MLKPLTQILNRPASLLYLVFLTGVIVYILALISRPETVGNIFFGSLSTPWRLNTFIGLPYEVILNSTALVSALFIINSALLAFFFILLQYAKSVQGKLPVSKSSLGGSLLSVFGVGCAACGSIMTPLLLALSAITPLTLVWYVNEAVSLLSTALLLFAIYTLLRRIQNPYL